MVTIEARLIMSYTAGPYRVAQLRDPNAWGPEMATAEFDLDLGDWLVASKNSRGRVTTTVLDHKPTDGEFQDIHKQHEKKFKKRNL